MKRIKYPTQGTIKRFLDYDMNTGIFVWKNRKESEFKKNQKCNSYKTWNTRFAGKEAGMINRNYRIIVINATIYQAHKLAYIYVYGDAPNDDIDHINRDASDNRIVNLRNVTRSQNMQNNGVQKNNTSGIRGVSFDNRLKQWHAYIKLNRKRIHLGIFKGFADAVQARYDAEVKHGFTEFNLNSTAYQYLRRQDNDYQFK